MEKDGGDKGGVTLGNLVQKAMEKVVRNVIGESSSKVFS